MYNWVGAKDPMQKICIPQKLLEELAEAKYPVKNQIAQGTHYESIQEKCTDKSKCGGKKYREIMRPVTDNSIIDVNEDTREEWFMNCMEKKAGMGKWKLCFKERVTQRVINIVSTYYLISICYRFELVRG